MALRPGLATGLPVSRMKWRANSPTVTSQGWRGARAGPRSLRTRRRGWWTVATAGIRVAGGGVGPVGWHGREGQGSYSTGIVRRDFRSANKVADFRKKEDTRGQRRA